MALVLTVAAVLLFLHAASIVSILGRHRTTTLAAGEKTLDERIDGFSTRASPAPGLDAQWRAHRRTVERFEPDGCSSSRCRPAARARDSPCNG